MIRLAPACIAVASAIAAAPIAHAQDVTGEWTGRYICGQGVTALHLSIGKPSTGNRLVATFSFGPLPENPGVPKGAYTMRGTYDAGARRLRLQGQAWISAPSGYVMVPLEGSLSASGDAIAGHIPGAFPCTVFEVRRPIPLIG